MRPPPPPQIALAYEFELTRCWWADETDLANLAVPVEMIRDRSSDRVGGRSAADNAYGISAEIDDGGRVNLVESGVRCTGMEWNINGSREGRNVEFIINNERGRGDRGERSQWKKISVAIAIVAWKSRRWSTAPPFLSFVLFYQPCVIFIVTRGTPSRKASLRSVIAYNAKNK